MQPSLDLAVSLVIYRPDEAWLRRTLTSLNSALRFAHDQQAVRSARVTLVDNQATQTTSPHAALLAQSFDAADGDWLRADILAGHDNVGYGAGNNLAIERHPAGIHLVMNPDVELARESIAAALTHLANHADCAMVTPVATAPDGSPLYLMKSYPSVFTLLLRGFAPAWLRASFAGRLARYDRSELPYDAPLDDARIVSGCFMMVKGAALREAKGFDPGYFLYFEDFDLSYRISRTARIARVPQCRIIHGGGGAARKGFDHIGMFVRSAVRFFRQHGWRFI